MAETVETHESIKPIREKSTSGSFSLKKYFKILILIFIAVILGVLAYSIWGWVTETARTKEQLKKAQESLDKMKQRYNDTLLQFQNVVKKTTLAHVKVGGKADGMPLTVKLRTMAGLGERVIEPQIKKTADELFCYQKNGSQCKKIKAAEQDKNQPCYACVPPMKIWDPTNNGKNLTLNIDGFENKDTRLLYVRRIGIQDLSGHTTTFEFDKALEEIVTQEIIAGSDVINASISVDALSENTTYALVTNQAGKYTLEKITTNNSNISPVRPKFIDTVTLEDGIKDTRSELNSADKWI